MVGMSESILADDLRRGGVLGGLGLPFEAAMASSSVVSAVFNGGVLFSVLLGESVDILSFSLSDSSAIMAV